VPFGIILEVNDKPAVWGSDIATFGSAFLASTRQESVPVGSGTTVRGEK
jgi:hypothetical protein